jgi:two-component system CheB/CheR fusion protein
LLRVKTASAAFYDTFRARPERTEGRLIYELGNGQWNIAPLRVRALVPHADCG